MGRRNKLGSVAGLPPVLEFLGEWGIRKVLVRGRRDFSVFEFVIRSISPLDLADPLE